MTYYDERLLDRKHGVAFKPLVALRVKRRGELPESWSLDNHVEMVGAHVVPADGQEKVADRALRMHMQATSALSTMSPWQPTYIRRNGIRDGNNCPIAIFPVLVCAKASP